METDVKLTKLASCAGCGAKVGAGTLSRMLEGFRTHSDPRLLVGYDKSDDASVYKITDDVAIVQTTDFFPPRDLPAALKLTEYAPCASKPALPPVFTVIPLILTLLKFSTEKKT